MKLVGRPLICLLLLAGSHAYCEEAPAPVIPGPAVLSADWWTYFEPKNPLPEEAARERLDNAGTLYKNLRSAFGTKDEAMLELFPAIAATGSNKDAR